MRKKSRGIRRAVLAIVLCGSLVTALAACDSGSPAPGSGNDAPGGSSEPGPSESTQPEGGFAEDSALHDRLPAAIKDSGVLHIAATVPDPPFWSFVDNSQTAMTGLNYDLATALTQVLGIKFEVSTFDFTGIVPALQSKKADVAWAGMVPTPDRLKHADFVLDVQTTDAMIVAKGNPKNIQNLVDLCDNTVAMQEGSIPGIALLESAQKQCKDKGAPEVKSVTYPSQASVLLAIQSNKADAFFTNDIQALYVAKTANDGNAFDAVRYNQNEAQPQRWLGQGVLVPTDNTELRDVLKDAMQKVLDDPFYLKTLKQYGLDENNALSKVSINTL